MNVRGIFPSLGAGGSLTAAVLCAAAIVGGGLAFRGEAGGTAEANTGDVNVPGATVRAQTSSPRPARTSRPRATIARREAPRRTPRVGAVPRRATIRGTVRRSTPMQRAAITPRAATPAPSAPKPVPSAKPSPATPVPALSVPPKPSGTVTKTVQQVRQVAKPVVDAVPAPAQGPVQTVTDTVQQVAGVVDQTVDGLLP